MMKLFNFSLRGNATIPNIKEESVTSSICVCVCVFFFFYLKKKKLETMCKKNQPKKIMH